MYILIALLFLSLVGRTPLYRDRACNIFYLHTFILVGKLIHNFFLNKMSSPTEVSHGDSATAPRTTVNPVAKVTTGNTTTSTAVSQPPGFRAYFLKWLGSESSPGFTMPNNVKKILFPIIWFLCTIFIVHIIHMTSKDTVFMSSLIISSFMIYFYPNEATSQPRNVLLGHILGALVGLIFNEIIIVAPTCTKKICFSLHASISVAVTGFIMMVFPDFLHMPGLITSAGTLSFVDKRWKYLGTPTIAGVLLIILLGLIFNNIFGKYPRYW